MSNNEKSRKCLKRHVFCSSGILLHENKSFAAICNCQFIIEIPRFTFHYTLTLKDDIKNATHLLPSDNTQM